MAIHARVHGAGRLSRKYVRAVPLNREIDEALDDIGDTSVNVFRMYAPVLSGRLRGAIESNRMGHLEYHVQADPRDPETGFPYTGVTRFGRAAVRPKRGNRALRFTHQGRLIFASRVRAWKPAGDWAARAFPMIDRSASVASERLGRRISARLQ